jgi:hypothetical protein
MANPGASNQAIESLAACAGVALPNEYIALLRASNGGEGPLAIQPFYFCLDSAEDTARSKIGNVHDESFTGFFIFGSNGSGEVIAFDLRSDHPWPVVAIDMTNINLTESVLPIARDFASFLELVGVEAP